MKAQRSLHRKVRALVAQRTRLIRELRAARAACRHLQSRWQVSKSTQEVHS